LQHPTGEALCRQAGDVIALGWLDLEDGVCAAVAEAVGCDVVATRDPSGFPDSPVRVSDPATVLAWLVAE
jgi:hypothetical protein